MYPKQHFCGVILRIPHQDHLRTFREERSELCEHLNMALSAGMAFLAGIDQPHQRQGSFSVYHPDHQHHAVPPDLAGIHHHHQGQMRQSSQDLLRKR